MKTAWVVLVGIFLAGSVQAQTINACYNKRTGDLRIANQCKKSENPISWNIQGLQGPKGDKGDIGSMGPKGDSGPTVYDATGQTMGIMAEMTPTIFIPSLQAFIILSSKGKVQSILFLYFETEDCTGTPYSPNQESSNVWNLSEVFTYDGKYYIHADERFTIKASSWFMNNACLRCCEYWYATSGGNGVYVTEFIPAGEDCTKRKEGHWSSANREVVNVQEVTLPFTEPISLPLSFK